MMHVFMLFLITCFTFLREPDLIFRLDRDAEIWLPAGRIT